MIMKIENYSEEKLLNIVGRLNAVKESAFDCNGEEIDFGKVTETCRIIDTLSLPLFYLWEHHYGKKLRDIGFHEHLSCAFGKFMKSPIENTLQIYLLISARTPLFKNWQDKSLPDDISKIYEYIIINTFHR